MIFAHYLLPRILHNTCIIIRYFYYQHCPLHLLLLSLHIITLQTTLTLYDTRICTHIYIYLTHIYSYSAFALCSNPSYYSNLFRIYASCTYPDLNPRFYTIPKLTLTKQLHIMVTGLSQLSITGRKYHCIN